VTKYLGAEVGALENRDGAFHAPDQENKVFPPQQRNKCNTETVGFDGMETHEVQLGRRPSI
jgi:hypothetical protein